jgi:hypothetical protein
VKEGLHMANKYMKRCSMSFVIRELQIKTMTTLYLLEWLESKKLTNINIIAGQDENMVWPL